MPDGLLSPQRRGRASWLCRSLLCTVMLLQACQPASATVTSLLGCGTTGADWTILLYLSAGNVYAEVTALLKSRMATHRRG